MTNSFDPVCLRSTERHRSVDRSDADTPPRLEGVSVRNPSPSPRGVGTRRGTTRTTGTVGGGRPPRMRGPGGRRTDVGVFTRRRSPVPSLSFCPHRPCLSRVPDDPAGVSTLSSTPAVEATGGVTGRLGSPSRSQGVYRHPTVRNRTGN